MWKIFLNHKKKKSWQKMMAHHPAVRAIAARKKAAVDPAAVVVGAVAGALFVTLFTLTQTKWKIDDVLGVWPLHGLCGAWGGIAAGIFGQEAFGGMGGVSLLTQAVGTAGVVIFALVTGAIVYGALSKVWGLRLTQEEEYEGADLSIHRIKATPEQDANW